MPYFNPGSWQPGPIDPNVGGQSFSPLPPIQFKPNPDMPVVNLPQPTPGVTPGPYVPDNPSNAIDTRPGFAPGANYYGSPIGGVMGPRQFFGNLYGGGNGGLVNFGGGLLSGLAGGALFGPAGSFLGNLLYKRIFNNDRAQRDPLEMMEIFGSDYEQMGGVRNPMQSRVREGSTRFSQGEMDLSNLPIERSPQQYMPAVFAGERVDILPGGGGRGPIREMR